MDMSVLRYLIWLLIIWLLRNTARTARQQTTFFSDVYAPRAGIWQGRERGFWVREAHEEGGRDFNIRQVDVYNAKNNSLLTGISLPSFPCVTLVPKTTFSLWNACHTGQVMSVNLFTLFDIQAICIFHDILGTWSKIYIAWSWNVPLIIREP